MRLAVGFAVVLSGNSCPVLSGRHLSRALFASFFLALVQNLARVDVGVVLRHGHEIDGSHFEHFGYLYEQAEADVMLAVFYFVEGRTADAQHFAEADLADARSFAQPFHVEADHVTLFGVEQFERFGKIRRPCQVRGSLRKERGRLFGRRAVRIWILRVEPSLDYRWLLGRRAVRIWIYGRGRTRVP